MDIEFDRKILEQLRGIRLKNIGLPKCSYFSVNSMFSNIPWLMLSFSDGKCLILTPKYNGYFGVNDGDKHSGYGLVSIEVMQSDSNQTFIVQPDILIESFHDVIEDLRFYQDISLSFFDDYPNSRPFPVVKDNRLLPDRIHLKCQSFTAVITVRESSKGLYMEIGILSSDDGLKELEADGNYRYYLQK